MIEENQIQVGIMHKFDEMRQSFVKQKITIFLLLSPLFFLCSLFIGSTKSWPLIWIQIYVIIGLLLIFSTKTSKINFPPTVYFLLYLLLFFYQLICDSYHFEEITRRLTLLFLFLLLYWYWNNKKDKYQLFYLIVIIGFVLSLWGISQFVLKAIMQYRYNSITGPFNNPAGISAAISAIYPLSLFLQNKRKNLFFIIVPYVMFITVLLSAARSGILSVITITIIYVLFKKTKTPTKAIHYFLTICACFGIAIGLYFIKVESADGRLLIWICSLNLVKQSPFLGLGKNGFMSHYMPVQAEYFIQNPDSIFRQLADNVRSPFNEYISHVVSYGSIGFLLSILLVILPVLWSKNDCSQETKFVRLGVLSLAICALFSYPMHYYFNQILAIIFISYLLHKCDKKIYLFFNIASKIGMIIISILILMTTINQIKDESKWQFLCKRINFENSQEIIIDYENLYYNSHLKRDGYFLYDYALILNEVGKYEQSNEILLDCCDYKNDTDVQLLFGDNFEKMNRVIYSEKHFYMASKMVPSKFFPLYRLVKLYENNNRIEEALNMANLILNKDIKIESSKIDIIKEEMRIMLDKYNN